jgi:opacity protein-like surface antigen
MSPHTDFQDKDFARDGVICGDAACATPGKISTLNSPLVGGGVGWRLSRKLRADATITYRGWYRENRVMPDGTNLKIPAKSWSGMLNGYYDFPFTWGTPYVGAGFGFGTNRVDDIHGDLQASGGTKSGRAWALMAGVSVPISSLLQAMDFGYRYVDLGHLETSAGPLTGGRTPTYSGASGKLKAHELTVGWRWQF